MTETIERVALAGYDGIEIPMEDATAPDVHDALEKTGLEVTSIGTGLWSLEHEFEENLEAARALDCEDLVCMWMGEDQFESPEALDSAADTLSEIAAKLAEHDCTLHYHNHDHEFVALEGAHDTAFDALVEATDDRVQFELDVGWVGTGGQDPIETIEALSERVSLVHLKDMAFEDGEFRTFGEGDLDIAGVCNVAEESDVDWLIFENDEPLDPVAEPSHARIVLEDIQSA